MKCKFNIVNFTLWVCFILYFYFIFYVLKKGIQTKLLYYCCIRNLGFDHMSFEEFSAQYIVQFLLKMENHGSELDCVVLDVTHDSYIKINIIKYKRSKKKILKMHKKGRYPFKNR